MSNSRNNSFDPMEARTHSAAPRGNLGVNQVARQAQGDTQDEEQRADEHGGARQEAQGVLSQAERPVHHDLYEQRVGGRERRCLHKCGHTCHNAQEHEDRQEQIPLGRCKRLQCPQWLKRRARHTRLEAAPSAQGGHCYDEEDSRQKPRNEQLVDRNLGVNPVEDDR